MDEGVNARKLHAIEWCQKLNSIDVRDEEARNKVIHELFGSVGTYPSICPNFNCDSGKNIHVGDQAFD